MTPTHTILLEDREVPYRLKRSPRRRTVGITVLPGPLVEVSSPARMAMPPLEAVLKAKGRWILKQMAVFSAPVPPPLQLKEGAALPFMGQRLPLKVCNLAGRQRVMAGNGKLWLDPGKTNLEGTFDPQAARKTLEKWYKLQAQNTLEERAYHFGRLLGVVPAKVRVKEQKRRWGSCNSKGMVYLNWRLIMAPPQVLDYVVAHELCHLKEMNHSPRFWDLVASVVPDWKTHRSWLKLHGNSLVW
ncbi:MAG: M48 family metallopeptidase [Deltaproteobacteria bacterium]|nr:M48 family metallopeptidase [Deltaproteobacteria bacterium]